MNAYRTLVLGAAYLPTHMNAVSYWISWISSLRLRKENVHTCKSVRESLAYNCLIVPKICICSYEFVLLHTQEINWLPKSEFVFIMNIYQYVCMCRYKCTFCLVLLWTPPQNNFDSLFEVYTYYSIYHLTTLDKPLI